MVVTERVSHPYEFGPFRLDMTERLLLRDGKPVPLTPKAYEMLLTLVERSGHIVGKDECRVDLRGAMRERSRFRVAGQGV